MVQEFIDSIIESSWKNRPDSWHKW